ncbi:MAG: putative DNA-binding domain-containing protein [Waddliaceae bacterium]
MTFDSRVPERLKQIQQWFAGIIGRRIDQENRINPIAPSGQLLELEAREYITPTPTLQPIERMQIYNQQYWWRLLKSLHENFPFATRLFGYLDFNEIIGFPYLEKYLSNHWSLSCLGNRLPQWVDEEYQEEDKPLVKDAVCIDRAYQHSFLALHRTPLQAKDEEISALLSTPVSLQPHLHLFCCNYDLFHFRDAFVTQDVDYWMTHDFPEMIKEKTYHFVLFRNRRHHLIHEEISRGEYQLLARFLEGNTIEKALDWCEQDREICEEVSLHLHLWLQKWIINQWLTPDECS